MEQLEVSRDEGAPKFTKKGVGHRAKRRRRREELSRVLAAQPRTEPLPSV